MDPDLLIIQNFLKQHFKIIVSILVVILVVIVSIPVVSYFANKSYFPLKNENLISKIPSNDVNSLKHYLEKVLSQINHDNVRDAIIREDSITISDQKYENDTFHQASFLIDIDSIQQTYQVNMTWYDTKKGYEGERLQISCPKISDSKYPDSECNSPSGTSHNVDLHLPYETKLSSGEKLYVKNTTIERNGKTLQIYLYSCDNDNSNSTTEAESLIRNWVKNTVKDPLADKYQYHVRTGYCENDPI